jgi:hypothetical protein
VSKTLGELDPRFLEKKNNRRSELRENESLNEKIEEDISSR